MFIYTLGESNKTWNGNSCALITITEVSTGKTKTFDDFTYFEDEGDIFTWVQAFWGVVFCNAIPSEVS